MKTQIEQGQKLKDGDYSEGLSHKQYSVLFEIENDPVLNGDFDSAGL